MPDPVIQEPIQSRKWSLYNAIRWGVMVVALGLLIYLLATQDWREFWRVLNQIPVTTVVAVLVLMLISRIAVCFRWYILLRSGGLPINPWQCIRLTFSGLFSNNFLPSTIGGDAVRLAGALKYHQGEVDHTEGEPALQTHQGLALPYNAVVTASLVADRLIGMAGMTTLLPMGLDRLLTVIRSTPASGLGLMPYAVAGVTLPKWFNRIWDWGWRFVRDALSSLMHWLRQPEALLSALFFTYINMASLFTTIWLLLTGMHQPISWWTVGSLWVFNYFASLLPLAVNGLGVQELAISYLYTRFGAVSTEAGLALALMIRFLYVLVSLPGAAFLPGLLPRERK
jgi:uncharacterized membrane protein YbhN (UPF0104 family)